MSQPVLCLLASWIWRRETKAYITKASSRTFHSVFLKATFENTRYPASFLRYCYCKLMSCAPSFQYAFSFSYRIKKIKMERAFPVEVWTALHSLNTLFLLIIERKIEKSRTWSFPHWQYFQITSSDRIRQVVRQCSPQHNPTFFETLSAST